MDASKLQKDHYQNESINRSYTPAREKRIEKSRRIFAGLKSGQRVLDIGCADGEILKEFSTRFDIHGVDISAFFVRQAIKNGLKARVHDIEKKPLPYPDKSFDIVYTGETIEHVVDTDWFLSEINRVLKRNGLLVLTAPNVRTWPSLLMMLFLDLPPMYSARYGSPHYRDFTLKVIKKALGFHHFQVEQSLGSDFYLPWVGDFGAGLADRFPSWAKTMIITSRKKKDSIYNPKKNLKFDLHSS